jgi:hypothetical protein
VPEPEDVRRDSYDDESSGEKSTTRVLVMLAILVSLVAVLGMLQVREKQQEAILWPTGPFDAGVSVLSVVYHPLDATAVVTVDEVGWRALSPENQNAIAQHYAQIAAPQGAKEIRVVGSSGLPLSATRGAATFALPPPPVP